MASVRSTIDLVITGATRGLSAASAEAEAMARRVANAEDRVSAARTRSAAAEEQVGAAEARLNGARRQQEAALSRIGVAETNLARTRQTANEGATRLSQAEADLDRIRRGGGSAEQIAAAENRINQVRQQSDLASRRLQQAEAQLATARANGERASARVAAAEAGLNNARSNAVRASEAAARAENDLNNLRRRGNQDTDRQRDGILGVFDAFSRLGNALTGADDAANRFLSTGAALHNLFTTIGGPIVQMVTGLLEVVAILGAAGEIVGVVGGLIGQALAGVPALLLSIGAAAGTVLLGMDGIKKAAEVAAPAFDRLKASVSGVFEKQLTPVFRDLAALLPKLTAGFNDIATAISGVAHQLVATVTSARGVTLLNQVLAGTANLVRGLGPGIAAFFDGLVQAAAAAAPAMTSLGAAIGGIAGKIGEVFTKLAADGTIRAAVTGLAATLQGLGDVLAPLVEMFIRMGAALGGTFGAAMSRVGAIIQTSIPFFEHLALVAGDLLVTAFEEIGPAIQNFIGNGIGPASSAMDQFASFIKTVIIPAIRDFINFLANDGISAIRAFVLGLVASITDAASGVLSVISGMLAGLRDLFVFLAVQTGDQKFLAMAEGAEKARLGVDGLKTTVESLHDKAVTATANVQGGDAVKGLATTIASVTSKTVQTISNVINGPDVGILGNDALTGAIGRVVGKTVATVGNVPGGPLLGTQGNNALTGAVVGVPNKTVTTTGNVPGGPTLGTQGNQALRGAIDNVISKTVAVTANVNGTDAVRGLISAIGSVVSKTVTVTVNTIQRTLGFASGGLAPGGTPIVVGEKGPELIVLPRSGGFVFTADQTRGILGGQASASRVGTGSGTGTGTGGGPITVTVNLSQQAIAGIAEVVVSQRDRSTKRTVLAGSGVTF